jgi:S-adenosylmethionine hydrolase
VSDIAHDFRRQDPRAAAFWLRFVLPEYPPAVHCVVIDPGVGTDRAALVVRAGDHALVGPDNGVLIPPARALATEFDVFEIEVSDPESATFHGRDVFAPTAADVHDAGVESLETLDALSPVEEYESLSFPEPELSAGRAAGKILVVDDFGNAITNVPESFLDGRTGEQVAVSTAGTETVAPVTETFASVEPGEPLVTVGSHGYVECDVNQGRGAEAFGAGAGAEVVLSFE